MSNSSAFVAQPASVILRSHFTPHISPRRPKSLTAHTTCLLPDLPDFYRSAEGLDEPEANMNMWNSVIHASLKRKLDGLAAENTVTNGVSALLHAAPGIISHVGAPALPHMRSGRTPTEVVAFLLQSFVKDALVGAKNFIELASEVNHVKRSTPHRLVLFVGDNENYRPLLRITHYDIHTARYEGSGQRCVLRADVYGTAERAAFDFQLSCEDGEWLIDEVFRL